MVTPYCIPPKTTMMNATSPRPPAVAWLGYGGLLPFVGTALACFLEPNHRSLWLQMLLAYGAVILSFVGALHWGFAMAHPASAGQGASGMYIWSIVPSLVGWVAVLVSPAFGAALLIAGFLTHYRQDLRLARLLQLPPWYLPLRLQLTVVACLCLVSVYFLEPALPSAAMSA
jgi:hypothetical protein